MSGLADKIAQARQMGFSDQELQDYILNHVPQTAQARQMGFSDYDILNHFGLAPQAGGLEDVANGLYLGHLPQVRGAMDAGVNALEGLVTGNRPGTGSLEGDYIQQRNLTQAALAAQAQQHPITSGLLTGAGEIPSTLAGGSLANAGIRAATAAAPEVGAFLTGEAGGNALTRAASQASQGAVQGATTGALTDQNNPLQGAATGAELGGIVGAGVPAAKAVANGVKNALLGSGPDPAKVALAQTLQGYGITVPGARISPVGEWVDNKLGFMPFTGKTTDNLQQDFTTALAKSFGEDATKLTPNVLDRAQSRIDQQMGNFRDQTDMDYDQTLHGDLSRVPMQMQADGVPAQRRDAAGKYLGPGAPQYVQKMINAINGEYLDKGYLPAQWHSKFVGPNGMLGAGLKSSDPDVVKYSHMVQDALSAAMQRSVNPEDSMSVEQLRAQGKNLQIARDAMRNGSATGLLPDPTKLSQLAAKYYGPNWQHEMVSAVPASNQLAHMAVGAQEFYRPPQKSSLLKQTIGTMIDVAPESILGFAAGHGGLGAAAGAGVGMAGSVMMGRLARSYLNSDAYRNALMGQGTLGLPSRAAIAAGTEAEDNQ